MRVYIHHYLILGTLGAHAQRGYCSWVYPGLSVSVCLLLSISLLGCLFVPETISSTQRATRVRIYVGFSLRMIRCRVRALPASYGYWRIMRMRLYLARPDPLTLSISKAQEVTTNGSRVISTTVASPCQTLCELLRYFWPQTEMGLAFFQPIHGNSA